MSFPVRQIDGVDDDGNVTTVTHSLSPDSMTLARGYDAMKEDPNIYKTLDLCGYAAPRQFPEMQLPVPGAPAPAQQSPGQFIPEPLITVMQCMHDEHVHFLKPLGRDPCTYFKEKDEERILRALGPDVVVCVTYRDRMTSGYADCYGMYSGFHSTSLLFGMGCVDGPGSLSSGAFNQLKLVNYKVLNIPLLT